MNKTVFEQKQEWIEKVMASDLTHAEKVFAFAIFTHMYGNKVEAWPATDDIIKAGGFKDRSHFPKYRTRLFEVGALTGEKNKRKGQWANYTYRLNLDWDGSTMKPQASGTMEPQATNHGASGIIKTANNTSIKDNKNNTVSAGASTVPLFLHKEDDSFLQGIEPSSLPQVDTPALVQTTDTRHEASGITGKRYAEYLERLEGREQVQAFYDGINKKRMRPADAVEYAISMTNMEVW